MLHQSESLTREDRRVANFAKVSRADADFGGMLHVVTTENIDIGNNVGRSISNCGELVAEAS